MGWNQVNPNSNGFVQVPKPKARFIPSRFVGKGQYQKKERAHWAMPNGSWAAGPPQPGRGGGSVAGRSRMPMPHSPRGPRLPYGGGQPLYSPGDPTPPSLIGMLQGGGDMQSRLQQILAMFALQHSQQGGGYAPYGGGGGTDEPIRY